VVVAVFRYVCYLIIVVLVMVVVVV
jgi:hypothetical protein